MDINSESGSSICKGGEIDVEEVSHCSEDDVTNAGTSPELTAEHKTARASVKSADSHGVKKIPVYQNKWMFGKIASFPAIDLKDGYLLSVS